MPLNEMTVGKVEWGVEALEAWGAGGRWAGVACRQTRQSQPSSDQATEIVDPDASLLKSRRDSGRPSDGDTGVGREAGGAKCRSGDDGSRLRCSMGGVFGGEGRAVLEVQRRDRLERWKGCQFSAFGALVLPMVLPLRLASWAEGGRREKREARVRVPSLANGSRADFGIITRGVRDGMGPGGLTSKGFQVADGDSRGHDR